MGLWDSFDKVYCLTLKDNILRQESAKKNLSIAEIDNYEFFYGSTPDEEEIKEVYRKKQLLQYPVCFRCRRTRCNCKNNILIPAQIACFRSFMRIFETASKSRKYKTFLVVEDDIEFESYFKELALSALNREYLESLHLFSNLPTLLSMGQGYCHPAPKITRKWKDRFLWNEFDVSECNVMFAFNKAFANLACTLFKRYETTSDIYIHRYLGSKCIHYSLFPRIAHDLSWSTGQLPSMIHPKKIYFTQNHSIKDKQKEIKRYKNHIKRCNTPEEYAKFVSDYVNN